VAQANRPQSPPKQDADSESNLFLIVLQATPLSLSEEQENSFEYLATRLNIEKRVYDKDTQTLSHERVSTQI
jgi:hypothetical protein